MRKRTLAVAIGITLAPPSIAVADPPPVASFQGAAAERGRFKYPLDNGGDRNVVLYDQTAAQYPNGVPAHRDSTGTYTARDSAGADDFHVNDPAGWTVSAFNFNVSFSLINNSAPPPGTTYHVAVYPNDGQGLPAPTPVCDYPQVEGVLADGNRALSIGLPATCFLANGHYWLSLQADAALTSVNNQMRWRNWIPEQVPGGFPKWRNPNNGFGTGCTGWRDVSNCNGIGGAGGANAFQVIGAPGGPGCDGSGLCVQAGAAPFDFADPDHCGADSAISVDIGTQINLCYRVRNESGVDLHHHSVRDNINGVHGYAYGVLLSQPLLAGQTYQYNHVHTVGDATPLTLAWTGYAQLPDYTATWLPAGDFTDISGFGTRLHMPSGGSRPVTMPFSFDFYGETTNELCIHSYGTIVVGRSAEVNCLVEVKYNNSNLPVNTSSDPVRPAIFALWDEFSSQSGDVYTHVLGQAPDRRYIVQWHERALAGIGTDADTATFQVVIHEATGGIRFEYPDVDYSGGGAGGVAVTVGMQGAISFGGGNHPYPGGVTQPFTQYSFSQGALSSGTAIDWVPIANPGYTSHATIDIDAGRPVLSVAPGRLDAQAADDTPTLSTLTIGNPGDRLLHWTVGEGQPNAHLASLGDRRRFVPPVAHASTDLASPSTIPSLTDEQIDAWRRRRDGQFSNLLPRGADPAIPGFLINGELAGPGPFPVHTYSLRLLDLHEPSVGINIGANGLDLEGYFRISFANNDFSRIYAAKIESDGVSDTPTGGSLAVIDTATAELTRLPGGSPLHANEYWAGLAWDPVTRNLYGAGCAVLSAGCHLYVIETDTFVVSEVAPITGLEFYNGQTRLLDIAIDSRGLMWGLDGYTSSLVAIDKHTGRANVVGPTGIIPGVGVVAWNLYRQGLDFDHGTDTLFWIANGSPVPGPSVWNHKRAYSIDLDTGAATLLGDLHPLGGEAHSPRGLAIPSVAGACASPVTPSWLSYGTSSGSTSPGGTSEVTVGFDPEGLPSGTYTGTLCVFGNARLVAEVPVRFTVENSDVLFVDGFEEDSP